MEELILATKIVFGNFKGGTGKTTNSTMISYHLANKGYKTLLVDLDPQANATSLLLLTMQRQSKKVVTFDKTLMTAISENDLSNIVTHVRPNLDLLPSFADFTSYPLFLEQHYKNDVKARGLHFKGLLDRLEPEYDYIIIDTPPTFSVYTDSAMLAADYVVIVLQTQERSLIGAEAFIKYMQELIDDYAVDFDIAGILPVLQKNNAIVDQSVLKNATQKFGVDNIFNTVVKNMERLKRYDILGIADTAVQYEHDMHDARVHKLYDDVTEELIERTNSK